MEFRNGGSSSQRRPAGEEGAPLARQGSVYSLTFDEFQSALGGAAAGGGGGTGKDFGSMNMDELLRNIWNAEETQAMASASASGAGGHGSAEPCRRAAGGAQPRPRGAQGRRGEPQPGERLPRPLLSMTALCSSRNPIPHSRRRGTV